MIKESFMETNINNKCKSFTSLEQSKKLADILPLESADMYFPYFGDNKWGETARFGVALEYSGKKDIPCWSLSALLGVLPSATLDSSDDHYYRVRCNEKFSEWHNNPIDTCVEMIDRLHEQMIYDFNNS